MPCSAGGSRLRVVSNIGAALQILIGGNISLLRNCASAPAAMHSTRCCDTSPTRRECGDRDARRRYDIWQGGTEVRAYATAIVVKAVR